MLAIIPARGGSKGIPGKNIRLLCGKPLIGYTIEAALAARSIDRIIISTDDQKIANIAGQYDVEFPFMRPPELAKDDSLGIDNYIYTIDRLNSEFDGNITGFVVLLPTVPLRSVEDIDNAVDLFHQKGADSIISCTQLHHPLEWVCDISEDGVLRRISEVDTKQIMNRQSSRQRYLPNGAVYVFKHALLKEKYAYYSDKTYAYVMPSNRSVDIDTELDFQFAEYLVSQRGAHA
jgi:N-acylneuraminate cytidylyltransferase/CMP-N,N'-diacetyllegionaminic acid synthase